MIPVTLSKIAGPYPASKSRVQPGRVTLTGLESLADPSDTFLKVLLAVSVQLVPLVQLVRLAPGDAGEHVSVALNVT